MKKFVSIIAFVAALGTVGWLIYAAPAKADGYPPAGTMICRVGPDDECLKDAQLDIELNITIGNQPIRRPTRQPNWLPRDTRPPVIFEHYRGGYRMAPPRPSRRDTTRDQNRRPAIGSWATTQADKYHTQQRVFVPTNGTCPAGTFNLGPQYLKGGGYAPQACGVPR